MPIDRKKMKLCRATTAAGKPCTSAAARGTKYCMMHGGHAAEMGRRGGLNRRRYDPAQLADLGIPKNSKELAVFIGTCMLEVRHGKLPTQTANCLGQLGMVFLKAVETPAPNSDVPALTQLLIEFQRQHAIHGGVIAEDQAEESTVVKKPEKRGTRPN